MKNISRFTLGSSLVVALVAISATAFAQNAPPAGACQGRGGHGRDGAGFIQHLDRNGNGTVEVSELPPRMAERMAAADTNRDGVLSQAELTAHMETQRAARFARMDTNGDGAFTADEVGARWERLQAADGNRDGRVSRDELQSARASGALRMGGHGRGRGRGHGGGGGAGFLQHFDRNGNGALEVSELPPRMAERMGAADTNRDGTLSPAELQAHREQRRAARQAQ